MFPSLQNKRRNKKLLTGLRLRKSSCDHQFLNMYTVANTVKRHVRITGKPDGKTSCHVTLILYISN